MYVQQRMTRPRTTAVPALGRYHYSKRDLGQPQFQHSVATTTANATSDNRNDSTQSLPLLQRQQQTRPRTTAVSALGRYHYSKRDFGQQHARTQSLPHRWQLRCSHSNASPQPCGRDSLRESSCSLGDPNESEYSGCENNGVNNMKPYV